MARALTYEQLIVLVDELRARNAELERIATAQAGEIVELNRRLAADSSNSSRPPSADAPWSKKPTRSSRVRSGRRPGKQPGAGSTSRRLVDDPDDTVEIEPDRCRRCEACLEGAEETRRDRRQIVDVRPAPPPEIIEYRRISKRCPRCAVVTTPNWDTSAEYVGTAADIAGDIIAAPGSPVRIGPETAARAALLACAHYLPIGRSRDLLQALTGIEVSTGFLAGIRGRAARKLEKQFLPHLRELLASAPILPSSSVGGHADGSDLGVELG